MFESHITVSDIDSPAHFFETCQRLRVKPVIIENDTGSSEPRQVMTAKFHKTNSVEDAMQEVSVLAHGLRPFGVIRRKLEYIGIIDPHLYLEFHSKYAVSNERLDEFVADVASLGGHTATNINKPAPQGAYVFATFRSPDLFDRAVGPLTIRWGRAINTIKECVVFDDNPSIDSLWHCMECPLKTLKGVN